MYYFLYLKIDLSAEELGNNTANCIEVQADLRSFCEQVYFTIMIKCFWWIF